jgi:hypothetical protein
LVLLARLVIGDRGGDLDFEGFLRELMGEKEMGGDPGVGVGVGAWVASLRGERW